MMMPNLKFVFIGLSITSSWGNGHATTFRSLIRGLKKLGHEILFLECDVPWYAANRDMPAPDFCETELYSDLEDLKERFTEDVRSADVVIVGSYVRDGVNTGKWAQAVAEGCVAFYDIDTPVTLAKLERGDYEYLSPELIPHYELYLSFSGGMALDVLQSKYRSPMARPLYCSFDPGLYYHTDHEVKWDLGYLGTYSDDRQPGLDLLMLEPARIWPEGKFVVAGPQYPETITWGANVERINHLPPHLHREFYNSQKFSLNITRDDMKRMGHSPSVRLFEAAACATPVISDWWSGLDELFVPGEEIMISRSPQETLDALRGMSDEARRAMGNAAMQRVVEFHTGDYRAKELESYVFELLKTRSKTSEPEYAAQG